MNAWHPASLYAGRPNWRCALFATLILASWTQLVPTTSTAAPTVFGDLTVVENRPVDDFFGFPGLHLLTRVDAGPGPGGFPITGATVSSSNSSFPFASPPTSASPLGQTFPGDGSWLKLSPLTTAQFPAIKGTYAYVVKDSSMATTSHPSHDLDFPAVVPHPTNLAVSNFSTTPLFTFTDPTPTPAFAQLDRVYDAVIFDSVGHQIAVLPSPTTSSTTPSFQIPSGLLTIGQQYWFRAQSVDIDRERGDFFPENIGESLLSFTPVPESRRVAALAGLLCAIAAFGKRKTTARRSMA